jgi:glutamate formiminotransferase/formiminotetrahydrofolate cyclodeaminase
MPNPLVECVPNFSEARRPEVVDAILQAMATVEGVYLLDHHSDMDHNRTVVTLAGPPAEVSEAVFRAIARAAELIDLDQHKGEHPRMGATDVVPFVPISGIDMQGCVELARSLGKRVAQELGIPVYLYEEAASSPERRNLEDLRRGEYEGLKSEIVSDPKRAPDFGPSRLGPAGATVIGARQFLVAFNAYLTTDEVAIARKIARAIRHSSGGLRYVKALGLLVEGRAQVSMNLTNYQETPVARVVEMIRAEARRYGTSIHHTELVGLIPEAALIEAAAWHLQLHSLEPGQILERRLELARGEQDRTQEAEMASHPFLEALAAGTPAPGGGSASAFSGAAGAALVAMVARLTVGKKKYAQVEAHMQTILERAENLRRRLTDAIQEDAAVFEAVMAAFKYPKGNPEEIEKRQQEIERATLEAARVPLGVARMAVEVLELALEVVSQGNLNAISDGASGAAQARAALTGAGYNVQINLLDLASRPEAAHMLQELATLKMKAGQLEEQIQAQLIERGGIPAG